MVGYSGGKDSSAVLQLVWNALRELPEADRTKPVHVISTDTLVEQPLVAAWVTASHAKMRAAAAEQRLPVTPHTLTPAVTDSFWVRLIGHGYPAPRQKFRWCTNRLKIRPSNAFIRGVVQASGEALLVLGTRKAESQKRAAAMLRHEKRRVRDRLSPNASLPNSVVYSPIEDWTNDDVWLYLMQVRNPWGHDNRTLLGMYQGASDGGECPLVVDTSTPSCGTSRFGCWTCTVVAKDRSMEAMIRNDEEKAWMQPLLDLRNELDQPDRDRRDFRRMDGRVQVMKQCDRTIPGPYLKAWREHWLRKLLEAQVAVRRDGPPEVAALELITLPELHEVRRVWLHEKHEFDDSLPVIYRQVMRQEFPAAADDANALRADDWEVLREVCGGDDALFALQVALLGVEREYRGMARRAGVYEALEEKLRAGLYRDAAAAVADHAARQERKRLALRLVADDGDAQTGDDADITDPVDDR